MIEVIFSSKIKQKKLNSFFLFLKSIASEVCFTSFHDYHLDEDLSIELIDEYKQKCKEKHHDLQVFYNDREPFLMKTLKKLKIKDEEEFQDYRYQIYQNDLSLCKKMEDIFEGLYKKEEIIDYKEIFEEIKDDFKYIETHMHDSVTMSLMPLDCVVYNFSDNLLDKLLKVKTLNEPIFFDVEKDIYFINMVFCKNEEVFCVIATNKETIILLLNEKEYEDFKKLKIRHKKGDVYDEEE